jgi:hypothetical protein
MSRRTKSSPISTKFTAFVEHSIVRTSIKNFPSKALSERGMMKILWPPKPQNRPVSESVPLIILRISLRKQVLKGTSRPSFDSYWSSASIDDKSDLVEYEKTILHGSELLSVPVRNMLFCRPHLSKMLYCSTRVNTDSDRALLALQPCRFRIVSVFEATKILNKWWKEAIFAYFCCGNWERKPVVSLCVCAEIIEGCREIEIQRFDATARSECSVLVEITSKYWTYWKTGFSTFCTKMDHLVKQGVLSPLSPK